MEKNIQDTTADILQRHLLALAENDMETLMRDYAPDAELWRDENIFAGTEAIKNFYSRIFTVMPHGSTDLEIQKRIVKDDKAYLVWTAESPKISITFATDCFLIKDGKIVWQSVAAQATTK